MKESGGNCVKGVAIFEGFEHIQNGVQQNTFGNIFLNRKFLKTLGAKTNCLFSLGVFTHLSFEEKQRIPPTVPSLAMIFSRICWTYSITKFLLHDVYLPTSTEKETFRFELFRGWISKGGEDDEDGFQRRAGLVFDHRVGTSQPGQSLVGGNMVTHRSVFWQQ